MNFKIIPLIISLIFINSYAHAEELRVNTQIIPEFNMAVAGEPLTIAIHQKIADGWHIYWKNAGDSGDATTIKWDAPQGVTFGDLLFPTPTQLPIGPLMNYGYKNQSTLLTTINIPEDIKTNSFTATATINWLACRDICIPEATTINITMPIAESLADVKPTDPDLFKNARDKMPKNTAWQSMVEEQDQNLILTFIMDTDEINELKTSTNMYFYPLDWGIIAYSAPQNISIIDDKLVINMVRDTRPLSDITAIRGDFAYQTADGTQKSIAINTPIMGAGKTISPPPSKPTTNTDITFITALFFAFLGGVILNLMPCVFPVLSMKALSLVKMSEREQKHANLHGIIYAAGIQLCFLSIAAVLIILQMTGEQIGWGFQLQNPAVVLALSYLLFVMALNLSGFFEFKSSFLSNIGHKLTTHHGYMGTFFTGVLATIVATPCTAPFMGTAMGYAMTQNAATALSVFSALGLGLAAPYLMLCFIPKLRSKLPKAGEWMNVFRQFMAFPLYASAVWLIWVYAQQITANNGLFLALIGFVLIGFSLWLSWHTPRRVPFKIVVRTLSITTIIITMMIIILNGVERPAPHSDTIRKYTEFTNENFDKLLAGNDPIFIDMTAAWCITCKINEQIAINTDATKKLFKDNNVQILIGDWTNKNPEITEFLQKYGRNGVPLYVYIGARDVNSGARPAPQILPQILTNGIIADTVKSF